MENNEQNTTDTPPDIKPSPFVSKSIRIKQQKLYDLCFDFLISNFSKFSTANKMRVALALAQKLASNAENASVNIGETKIVIVRPGSDNTEQHTPISIVRPNAVRPNSSEAISG
jgi:hypothetical protein